VGTGPRIVLTPRAEQHDEPRGRLFDGMTSEQAMAVVERLVAAKTRRSRVLDLA
jgi:hypothetical protein